jgi:hypothetical protein
MPRLTPKDDAVVFTIPGGGNFQFSGVRIDKNLGASDYTLVTIVLDVSGSVDPFKNDLLKFVETTVAACKKSPRHNNLMLRFVVFNHNVQEMHGFIELNKIDPKTYKIPSPDGTTALVDASYDAIGATITYAEQLIAQDFMANGAVYIITDGMENASRMMPKNVAKFIQDSKKGEKIESLITILVGMHDPKLSWAHETKQALEDYRRDAGIDQFVDIGAATPQRLAKLAGFVSQSVSSQSQNLGTGAPSQPPSITF